MAPEPTPEPKPVSRSGERDTLRRRDWVVAIGLALVLVLIIAAIFRNGLAYLYG